MRKKVAIWPVSHFGQVDGHAERCYTQVQERQFKEVAMQKKKRGFFGLLFDLVLWLLIKYIRNGR